jgi:hypothetical protein
LAKNNSDVKSSALTSGLALKVLPYNFAGLDANGVPTGFSVTDSAGNFGTMRTTTPTFGSNKNGATISYIATTDDPKGAYLLLGQTLTLNGTGATLALDPAAVSVKNTQYSADIVASNTTMSRLDDGSFLITSTNIAKLDLSTGTIGGSPANVGVDLRSAPSQIVTRIHLSSDQTKILGQAVEIVTR